MQYPPYPMPMGEPQPHAGQPPMAPQPMPYMPPMPPYPGYPPMYGHMYPHPTATHPYGPSPQMPLLTLDEGIKAYVQFKVSKGKDPKTITDIELALRMLPFVRPDIQLVNHITKRLILEFEALIAEIPVNYRKSPRLRNLRYEELKAVTQGKPRISPATIDKYVITLRSFIHWCQDTDRMPNWKLPKFEGLDKRNSKDKRHPFTKDELQKLFSSPMFTGHQPDRDTQLWRHKEGPMITKDHFYWVPWIALYSGMRLREIVQLEIKDIRQEEGVYYMDVNEDGEGKSLKNHASRRQVPIHGKLVEMGLLDYVESLREQGHKRLFPHAQAHCRRIASRPPQQAIRPLSKGNRH